MLDSFGICFCVLFIDTKGDEKIVDKHMPLSGGLGEFHALIREEDASVGLGFHVPVSLEALDGF